MASCGPVCTVPSCASTPVVGFGSAGIGANYGYGLGYGNLGYGGLGSGYGGLTYGRLGSCYGGLSYGGLGSGYGGLSYGGLGSCYGGLSYGGLGSGYGGLSYGGLGYGYEAGALGLGGSTNSEELGTLAGVIPQPINQTPASEVVVQPPACIVTVPGPILSASCEPVLVGGNTPCAVGGSGIGGAGLLGSGLYGGLGYGSLGYGGWGYGSGLRRGGFYGSKSPLAHGGSVCI